MVALLDAQPSIIKGIDQVEPLPMENTKLKVNKPSLVVQPPIKELKPLPKNLTCISWKL